MLWVWGTSIFFCMMAWGGSNFLYLFVFQIAISFLFSNAAIEQILGRKKLFRYKIYWILFGLALLLMIQLFGKYTWISFYILCASSISSWLSDSLFGKRKPGQLLIDLGRTLQNKCLFWMGLFLAALSVIQLWLVFHLAVYGNTYSKHLSLDLELARLIFTLSVVSFLIALGLNRFEFRENGICFMYSFIKWQSINSYSWWPSNPNDLVIGYKSKSPLLPGLMSVGIPEEHKDRVRFILDHKLPGKNL